MKKLLFLTITILTAYGSNLLMPPSIPNINIHSTKKKKNDACKIIPPMLIHLPPMLENDLAKCKNSLYLPSKTQATLKLSKLLHTKINIKKITILNDFNMLYKIDTTKGSFICNKNLNACFMYSKIIKGK